MGKINHTCAEVRGSQATAFDKEVETLLSSDLKKIAKATFSEEGSTPPHHPWGCQPSMGLSKLVRRRTLNLTPIGVIPQTERQARFAFQALQCHS